MRRLDVGWLREEIHESVRGMEREGGIRYLGVRKQVCVYPVTNRWCMMDCIVVWRRRGIKEDAKQERK